MLRLNEAASDLHMDCRVAVYLLSMHDLNQTIDQTLCPVLSSSLEIVGFNLLMRHFNHQEGDAAFKEVVTAKPVMEAARREKSEPGGNASES